jgi:hypothetical protein
MKINLKSNPFSKAKMSTKEKIKYYKNLLIEILIKIFER